MTIFDLLIKDHQKVNSLFQDLEENKNDTNREASKNAMLFEEIKNELLVHTELEEKILYPVLKQYSETKDEVEHAYKEHQEIKDLLDEISKMSVDGKLVKAKSKLALLKANVMHHVEEEETEVFPLAKKVIEKDIIVQMTDDFKAQKAKITAKAPRTTGKPPKTKVKGG